MTLKHLLRRAHGLLRRTNQRAELRSDVGSEVYLYSLVCTIAGTQQRVECWAHSAAGAIRGAERNLHADVLFAVRIPLTY